MSDVLLSKTAWLKKGYRVKKEEINRPHAQREWYVGGGWKSYNAYRHDQVEQIPQNVLEGPPGFVVEGREVSSWLFISEAVSCRAPHKTIW